MYHSVLGSNQSLPLWTPQHLYYREEEKEEKGERERERERGNSHIK